MSNSTDSEASRTIVPQMFCRACASPLIQATDWDQQTESLWSVRLWCPECGFEQSAILDRLQVNYLSLAIEEGFARMLEALDELEAATGIDVDLVKKARSERVEPAGF